MSRSAAERIADIRRAIARCLTYSGDLDNPDERMSRMSLDAIERNISIVGEAAFHLPQAVTDELPEIDWPAIRGMRNILIHEYFGVEVAVVRDVIESKLTSLDSALAQFEDRHG